MVIGIVSQSFAKAVVKTTTITRATTPPTTTPTPNRQHRTLTVPKIEYIFIMFQHIQNGFGNPIYTCTEVEDPVMAWNISADLLVSLHVHVLHR